MEVGKNVLKKLIPRLFYIFIGIVDYPIEIVSPEAGNNNGVADPKEQDSQTTKTSGNNSYILEDFDSRNKTIFL